MITLPTKEIIKKFNSLNQELAQISDQKELIKLSKEHKKLQPQYELSQKIEEAQKIINQNEKALETENDEEIKEMLKEENQEKETNLEDSKEKLLTYLTPSDPRDDENILLEIRAGAGGDESSLFTGEMLKMYTILAENTGLKAKVITANPRTVGGYKEVIVEVRGDGAYSLFKYEGGVHRVQRVPETEKQGRIHTSTVSVAIMPLIDSNDEFKLDPNEVETIITTSSGNGGQSVNTTYSAVHLRHLPTGIEARSQDERDQQQNKLKAMQVLTSRVFDFYEQERLEKEYEERKSQVGRADRSEKIRTYNFPQDRLTDHRYQKNWSKLPEIMTGEIESVINDIRKIEAEETLKNLV